MEHLHFIGIGGAGMSVLAHAMLDQGAVVSGSDQSDSAALDGLRRRGVSVTVGHCADNPGLAAADRVIVSAAVHDENAELAAALAAGKPVQKRAAILGELMDTRTGVAVAGTHGKTTTTAMIAWTLREAGRDPAFLVGGVLSDLGTGGHWGSGPELVAEADEYDGSFWELRPQVAVITNIEADHLDYYADLGAIDSAFRRFAGNLRPGGTLLLCGDDPGARRMHAELEAAWAGDETGRRAFLYGTCGDCDIQASDERINEAGGSDFVVRDDGHPPISVSLLLPGHHNVLNVVGAISATAMLGVPPGDAASALARFHGTQRRFQVKGVTADGALVVDDYAHHPTEISANLAAARRHMPGRRLVVVHQPHTYSRTRDFLDGFAAALAEADVAIICTIYPARETDTLGVSAEQLVARINAISPGKAHYAPDLAAAANIAAELLQSNDVLLTMGAGDVWQVGEALRSFEF